MTEATPELVEKMVEAMLPVPIMAGTYGIDREDAEALARAALAATPISQMREALDEIERLTERPDISDGAKVIFIRRIADAALDRSPTGEKT